MYVVEFVTVSNFRLSKSIDNVQEDLGKCRVEEETILAALRDTLGTVIPRGIIMVELNARMVIEEEQGCLLTKLLATDHGLPLKGGGPAALP